MGMFMGRAVITIDWFAQTEKGPYREVNQDALLAFKTIVAHAPSWGGAGQWINSDDISVWAVSDGMGGHQDGEKASLLAVSLLAEAVQREWGSFIHPPFDTQLTQVLVSSIKTIHEKLSALGEGQILPMGCTLTGVGFFPMKEGPQAYVFHVGDTRLWRFRAGELTLLTEDHNQGWNKPNHQGSNILTSCLGAGTIRPRIDVFPIDIQEKDLLLLSSDGLLDGWDARILKKYCKKWSQDLQNLTDQSVHTSLNKSHDNISLITLLINY